MDETQETEKVVTPVEHLVLAMAELHDRQYAKPVRQRELVIEKLQEAVMWLNTMPLQTVDKQRE
jgi:hypothetical protein